jgi:Aspartyl protease
MKIFSQALVAFALLAIARASSGSDTPLGTFPFKRDGQLILVDVSINNSAPALFVVDSGAPHTVFDPKFANELGLKTENASSVTGTGKGAVATARTGPVTMRLHDVKVDLPEPWVIDLSKVPIPRSAKGLVGAEIFKTYVVGIDPLQSTFSVFDPTTYRYTGKGASLPLFTENGKLFLEADLEVPAGHVVTHKLRIDIGSESSVNDDIVKQSTEVRVSTLGSGLGESFKAYSGVFSSVKIGPFVIKHVWGPGGPGPAIGMEMLRRFIITFDAPHNRIYLEPTPALTEPVPTPPTE